MSEHISLPWLNKNYITTILIKFEGHDKLQLNDFHVNYGMSKGESYASVVYRVKCNYTINNESNDSKDVTLILKTRPTSSAISEMMDDMDVFESECYMYEEVLPEYEKLIPECQFSPRYAKRICPLSIFYHSIYFCNLKLITNFFQKINLC